MSRENVELVKRVHPPSGSNLSRIFGPGAEGAGPVQAVSSLLAPDFEAVGGDLTGASGLSVSGNGIDGLIRAWRDWLVPWDNYWTHVEEIVDIDDDRVLVLVRDHGQVRGSDAHVENISASIWTLRDGKIARIEFHVDRRTALEAVGLADRAPPRPQGDEAAE